MDKKKKSGFPRLLELAGEKKGKLIVACILSIMSSAAKIFPFFSVFWIITAILPFYNNIGQADGSRIMMLTGLTFGAALIYGLCAYGSSALAHTAAYDIIYELRIKLIPATINRATSAPIAAQVKRKVAGYARVSTELEEQQSSYEAQVSYYTDYIKGRSDWEVVKVYTDDIHLHQRSGG